MSELINSSNGNRDFRWKLLTTVSALALICSVCTASEANAADEDGDHPTVWIELGGQLERLGGGQTPFAPPFFDAVTKGGLESPLEAGRSSIYSNGAEGEISLTPEDLDWIFSAAVRYGRSSGNRFLHQQQKELVTHLTFTAHTLTAPGNYAQTTADNSESHIIADFQAGKDVGLGLLGSGSTSTISLGVRLAQFSAKSNSTIHARPDVHFEQEIVYGFHLPANNFHEYFGSAQRSASFRGLGPSISWNASAPLIKTAKAEELTLDWGANAAVMFGRQKAGIHHQSSGSYRFKYDVTHRGVSQLPTHHGTDNRSRSVVVPNIGGFAGVSYNFPNAKVSIGYRGDFFFGAMDGGLDTHKSYNQEFYGPFATISVGFPQ